jgi:hypothetical protein
MASIKPQTRRYPSAIDFVGPQVRHRDATLPGKWLVSRGRQRSGLCGLIGTMRPLVLFK